MRVVSMTIMIGATYLIGFTILSLWVVLPLVLFVILPLISIWLKAYNSTSIRMIMHRPMARAYNDRGERIESMKFTVPALRVGVLDYAPGQLTTGNSELDGKTIKLYYPPEAVSDAKFLKSLETAPVVVGSHDSTTSENNKKIDGWAQTVRYDDALQAAMIDGVVKGNKEIAYIKTNIGINDFGASAFVDIYGLKVGSGTTPDGQFYNAIATDLRATHVALAPHVRDPENKIEVKNAVVLNTRGEIKDSEGKSMDPKEIAAIVKNAVEETMKAKNADDKISELESAIVQINEALNEIKESMSGTKNAVEEIPAGGKGEKKKDEVDGATVENAKPSQALVAAFATALNIDFKETPSFSDLASLSGISEIDPFARISAVNAKFAELSAKVTAKNTESKVEVF